MDNASHPFSHLEFEGARRATLYTRDYVADDQPINLEDVSAPGTRVAEQPSEKFMNLGVLEDGAQEFY